MHFLKHMLAGRRCGLWKSGGMYKIFSGQRPFSFHDLLCRGCPADPHANLNYVGRLETWTCGGQRLVWDKPSAVSPTQTALPWLTCWQKFGHLCPRRDLLVVAVPMDREAWVPLWLPQILQNSWKWAEITGYLVYQARNCRGWRLKPSEDPILQLATAPWTNILFLTLF